MSRCEKQRWSQRVRSGVALTVIALLGIAILLTGVAAVDNGHAATLDNETTVSEPLIGADNSVSAEDDKTVLLVYFDDEPSADLDDIAERQSEIAESQTPLREYAAETPGVTIERQYWIQNVAAVSVDTETNDPGEIAAIDAVADVRENVVLSAELGSFSAGSETERSQVQSKAVTERSQSNANIEASWGLNAIDAPTVWEAHNTRGDGVTIAVLDSGVDTTHPEIDIVEWADWDTDGTLRNTDPQDYDTAREPSGHGTHVIGTLIAEDRSGTHLGVSPDADVMAGAALTDCDESGCDATAAQILSGIEWAVANDADVLSISIGLETKDQRFVEPIRNAQEAGTVVIASGGNDGFGSSTSPGNDYDSISVGAADANAEIIEMSGGELVYDTEWQDPPADWPELYVLPKLAAPGWEIPSAIVSEEGDYSRATGTSQAAPHVAGTAALIQSATDEQLTHEEIEAVLIKTAFQPTDDEYPNIRYGHGIINAADAVDLAVNGDYDVDAIEPSVPEDEFAAIPDDDDEDVPDEVVEEPDEDKNGEASDNGEVADDPAEDDGQEMNGDDESTANEDDGTAADDTDAVANEDDEMAGFGVLVGMATILLAVALARFTERPS